jgi:GGDEF domain-containing protein
MQVFDKVSQQTLDRRDRQLSILALIMVVVLGGGMAVLMYPTVFGKAEVIPVAPSETLFFGFCALCILMVVYLINRMTVVHQLRDSLVKEHEQLALVQQQSSAELLGTLMGFSHFQDRLTMDFRRAAQTSEPLSLLLVRVKVLSRKLRAEDSLFRLASHVFGIVLPGAKLAFAQQTANRLAEGLADASGASNRYIAEIQVVNYPEQASAASEMERHASVLISAE